MLGSSMEDELQIVAEKLPYFKACIYPRLQ